MSTLPPLPAAETSLGALHPGVRPAAELLLGELEARGFRPAVIETWRTAERHRALVARKVTWTEWSFHGYIDPLTEAPAALALDVIDRRYGWGKSSGPFFDALAELAEARGFVAGHRWRRRDSAHIQAVPVSALAALRAGGAPDLSRLRA